MEKSKKQGQIWSLWKKILPVFKKIIGQIIIQKNSKKYVRIKSKKFKGVFSESSENS